MKSLIFSYLLLSSLNVLADAVDPEKAFANFNIAPITGTSCLKKNVRFVYDSIKDYANYHKLDDKIKFIVPGTDLVGVGTKQVEMVESNAFPGTPWDQDELHSLDLRQEKDWKETHFDIVKLAFSPLASDNQEIFPRFYLRCRLSYELEDNTNPNSDMKELVQDCLLIPKTVKNDKDEFVQNFVQLKDNTVKEIDRFALYSFKSKIRVLSKSTRPACRRGTEMIFGVKLVTHNKEVDKIKSALVNGSSFGVLVINQLFDENIFFSTYYEHLFNDWLSKFQ